GGLNGEAHLIGSDGKAIVFGGAPNLGFSISDVASRFNPLTLVDGTWPKGDQVVIDKSTASKKHFKVGDEIGVQSEGPVEKFRIFSTIGGATLAGFDVPTAQRLFDKPDQYDEIAIATKPGTSPQNALQQVRAILPPDAQARTGAQQAKKDAHDTNSFISFLRT